MAMQKGRRPAGPMRSPSSKLPLMASLCFTLVAGVFFYTELARNRESIAQLQTTVSDLQQEMRNVMAEASRSSEQIASLDKRTRNITESMQLHDEALASLNRMYSVAQPSSQMDPRPLQEIKALKSEISVLSARVRNLSSEGSRGTKVESPAPKPSASASSARQEPVAQNKVSRWREPVVPVEEFMLNKSGYIDKTIVLQAQVEKVEEKLAPYDDSQIEIETIPYIEHVKLAASSEAGKKSIRDAKIRRGSIAFFRCRVTQVDSISYGKTSLRSNRLYLEILDCQIDASKK